MNSTAATLPTPPPNPPAASRHHRKCSICHHPNRADIDHAFLHWQSSQSIVDEFHLPSRSALYRHARATSLDRRRRMHMRAALEQVVTRAGIVPASGTDVVEAVHLCVQFSDDGAFLPQPGRRPVVHNTARRRVYSCEPPEPEPAAPPPSCISRKGEEKANRDGVRVESPVTPTKQSTGLVSNRDQRGVSGAGFHSDFSRMAEPDPGKENVPQNEKAGRQAPPVSSVVSPGLSPSGRDTRA